MISLTEQSNVLALPGEHSFLSPFRNQHKGTLVVVDMQPGFSTASRNATTIASVELLIAQAVADERDVVVLENEPWRNGFTYWRLLKHLAGYKRKVIVPKSIDDGSRQVIEACTSRGFDDEDFEFGGVHTDACVKKTVGGVAVKRKFANIRVFKEACYSNTPSGMWNGFSSAPNVSIVSLKDYTIRRES